MLQDIQAAWSAHNVNALGAVVTPEMLSYFGEQLAEQTSRGVRNEVTDVRLLQGDLAQGMDPAWPRLRHRRNALFYDRRDSRQFRPNR